jgi:MATE family multidrug resistance protein
MLIAQALAAFYSGRGKTFVVMFTDGAFALLNLVLAYAWILGKGGFPAGGVVGAGWATTISLWLKAITYLALFLQRKYREQFGTLIGLRFDRKLLARLLFYGGPSGLQMLLDTLGFTAFILLVGRLGVVESEATGIAFSISTLAFMPIWGLHLAVSVLVGERLGENRDDLAARATFTTLQVAWIYMFIISLIYLFAPGIFLGTFFPHEASLTPHQAEVYHTTAVLLRFVAAYNLFDATLMIFAGAIKGAGDTTFIFWVSLGLAIFLATASYLAVEIWRLDVKGCWGLVIVWVWTAAAIYAMRFLHGKWRSMRVIEASPVAA